MPERAQRDCERLGLARCPVDRPERGDGQGGVSVVAELAGLTAVALDVPGLMRRHARRY